MYTYVSFTITHGTRYGEDGRQLWVSALSFMLVLHDGDSNQAGITGDLVL